MINTIIKKPKKKLERRWKELAFVLVEIAFQLPSCLLLNQLSKTCNPIENTRATPGTE
jgi:hypothetical protein